MKKLISYILLFVLLFTAIPSFSVSAAETVWSGELTANGNNINVTLAAPQTETEDITSLHFKIYISIADGKMDAPTFEFASTVESKVKDAAVIIDGSSNYILDIILSGTKDQNIFKTNKQADIGTISLHPTTSTYKITVDFIGITSDNKEPAAEYVTSDGQFAEEVPLVDTKSVDIEKTDASGSSSSSVNLGGSSGSSGGTVGSGGTVATAAPSTIPSSMPNNTPVPSPVPNDSAAPSPVTTEPPTTSQEPVPFDSQKKPKLNTSVKKGSNHVNLTWNKIDGADGYIIYQYNKANAKYKAIKTISNSEKTSCSLKMSYGTSYSFRICAFQTSEDGSKIYGKYSNVIKVTTAPAKVNGLKVKRAGKSKISLSWKKVKKASGYQIFSSKKKNGKYTLVKTLKKGSTLSVTVKQKDKKTYYYKVRAYVTNASKERVYGNFGKKLSLKSK